LETVDELNEFEKKLTTNKEFRMKLVKIKFWISYILILIILI
jgi:hypothetical protein